MDNINCISTNLANQLKLLENNVLETTNRFKDVQIYINRRLKKLKRMVPLITKSNDWTNKLSSIIDLFDEVQRVLEKVDELDGTIIQEVSLEDEIDIEEVNDQMGS